MAYLQAFRTRAPENYNPRGWPVLIVNAAPLDDIHTRLSRLRRQIIQHQDRGVPLSCLSDLLAELARLEWLLNRRGVQ